VHTHFGISEVDEFFFTAGTRLHHFPFTWSVGFGWGVAFHFGFVSHFDSKSKSPPIMETT
jgi:hypothetical protein